MAKNKYTEACDRIRPLLPENVKKLLGTEYDEKLLGKFSEDFLMVFLEIWLKSNLKQSSKDPTSVAVYAAFYNCPEWFVKQFFEENGL